MANQLTPGELIVAKGKVAKVKQVFSDKTIRVTIVDSGEVILVSARDIQRIPSVTAINGSDHGEGLNVNDYTVDQLSLAAERFEIIRKWKVEGGVVTKYCSLLGVSKSYFYRLAKIFDADVGPLSLIAQTRGVKKGVTRLDESVEVIIFKAAKKFKSKGASYSKVWSEVDVACKEQGFSCPSKDTVLRRVRLILSEKTRMRIKEGPDAATQEFSARPGKKNLERPLQWVQMDHTLVDIILLADDRINIIGRPWLTIVIDVYTRVILGYYLSLYVPSTVSVACALSHSVLPKVNFSASVGLDPEDYPYYGKPEVLHMDNAAEFTSPKFKVGCESFGISPEYRPVGRKHFGGHVERLIGTFMTTKVHFLPGTTMSNSVARRGLNSDRNATMTFSDFFRWFSREVVVYHSTVHSALKCSPRQAWTNYFAPNGGLPYPPAGLNSEQLKIWFMPQEDRKINPGGINLHGQVYWDPILGSHVGTRNVIVKYDPYDMNVVWVKLDGQFCPIHLSDVTVEAPTYEEYRAGKLYRHPVRIGAIDSDGGLKAYRGKQKIEEESKKLTQKERRREAAEKVYTEANPNPRSSSFNADREHIKPNYSASPKKFRPGDES
ncbi:Mu transposase C-terminal domain-containing protein [Pseudomonas koreensis]|uniref:Mu transposase C-terminal domain-containing protein n=1 Tax=Pseudomonas koreensis TaxID=198620 RepID=UPI00078CA328|nr:Mu transposase C-terminal domain-containing protein [Pseudomonas koreensis]AMT89104.1 integrase [Pseudomonas koreensis]